MTDEIERSHRESAELLGLDPAKLTPAGRLKTELVSALRSVVDDELAKVSRANAADLARLITAVQELTRFMKESPAGDQEIDDDDGSDPHANLQRIIASWIEAENADRAERGLAGLMPDLPTAQARIDELEARLAEFESVNSPKALPAPAPEGERIVDPPTGDIMPRSEWQGVPPMSGPDDWKVRPKPVIEAVATEAPKRDPNLRPVPGIDPMPTCSGEESERRRQAANARRDIDHKVMNAPAGRNMPQPSVGGESWRFRREGF